ncbi:hypothetical protein HAD_11100 [Hyphomonas adhaerens MHS-3]|uniref:TonB-dependent receptor n=2 Tax=Hyphomonas adhaerens TaxID=81029 RepID=A0A069E8C4_9PROT|nr:hypothetical protein HAD_11100 [Hyphomonas adhaerens MHS-3]
MHSDPRQREKFSPIKRAPKFTALVMGTSFLVGLTPAGFAAAQDQGGTKTRRLEAVTVTAQKRESTLQDASVSLQVLGEDTLDQLEITNFDDYANFLPSVSFNSLGPGEAQVYIRGVSDGGDGNASGSQPSVGIYLDEQPVTAIGRNLDVHIYDVSRIEVLGGPQGTLYGANSQAGTIRIITNAPDPSAFEAGYDLNAVSVENGGQGYTAEGFVNMPINEKVALRLVGWYDKSPGYIDAIAATKTFSRSGVTINNDGYVEDNFNESTKAGARAALGIDINESWTATAKILHQRQESDGVWDHDPEDLGDLEVARFSDDHGEDTFTQYGVTVEGDVGGVSMTYAGTYLDREVDDTSDYTEYAEYSSFIDYYTCYYAYDATAGGYNFYSCEDPRISFREQSKYERQSHELRFATPEEKRLRFIGGVFYQDSKHSYVFDYRIPNIKSGYQIRDPNTYFVTDQVREDKETALFGEVYYDLTDTLTATVGGRFFETETSISGEVGTVFGLNQVDAKTDESGSVYKVNLSWEPTDDLLFYGTISEGFRPGGVNREETSNIPQQYKSDLITNYEIGWKTELADGQVRLNGSAFLMDWEDVQFTRFDPSESQLGLTSNAGAAEVKGIEADVAWLATQNLTVTGAFTLLNAELTEDFTQNVNATNATPDAASGTRLPFIPEYKAYVNARYDFRVNTYDAFVNGNYSIVGSSYNDLYTASRQEQDGYGLLNMTAGFGRNNWEVKLLLRNLTDERAELYRNAADFDSRITTNRPRSIGVSFSQRF